MKIPVVMNIETRPGMPNRCSFDCPAMNFSRFCKGCPCKDGTARTLPYDRDGYPIRCAACKNAEVPQ